MVVLTFVCFSLPRAYASMLAWLYDLTRIARPAYLKDRPVLYRRMLRHEQSRMVHVASQARAEVDATGAPWHRTTLGSRSLGGMARGTDAAHRCATELSGSRESPAMRRRAAWPLAERVDPGKTPPRPSAARQYLEQTCFTLTWVRWQARARWARRAGPSCRRATSLRVQA
jgi:hypothetical protein